MKKIDRYILIKFIKSFLIGTFAFLNIFILRELFSIISYIIDGKLNIAQGIELLMVGLPEVIIQVTPLGVLLGGLMTVNELAKNLEITALKTSGISFRRIVIFPIIFTLFLSVFLLWFNNNVVPESNQRKRELKYSEVYKVKDSRVKSDVFLKGSGNYLYYVRLVNGSSQSVNNIQIVELDDGLKIVKKIITAKRGNYNPDLNIWRLYNVKINNIEEDKTYSLSSYNPNFLKEDVNDFLRDKIRENEMSISELRESATFIRKTGGDVKKILTLMYKKMAYPFASIIMAFVGLSLGSKYVRGSSAVSIGLSVVIGYVYYIVMATMEAMGVGGYVSPLIGAWIPNILFLTIGILTMRKAEY
ncbi:MAG: LptF/LptG family permease [Fusobacteriota bacterium]